MTTLSTLLVFILILLLYIHITAQYKRSEDLEIYEADYKSNQDLQDICDIKQPVLFHIESFNPIFFEHNISDILEHSKTEYEARVKDVNDIKTGDYILIPFRSAYGLMETDSNSRFYSENNYDMTEDIIAHHFKTMDEYLKPKFTLQTKYDVIFGSNGAYTTLKYHTNYRQFLCVQKGKITVKMTPWKSRKLLHIENDYENYEFRSHINVWKPQYQYLNDMEKLKFLEFDIQPGYMLFIPPYWFYSIQFNSSNDDLAMVASFTYNTPMNIVANSPKLSMYYLQQFNVTQKTVKTLNIEPSSSTTKAVREPEKDENSTIVTNAPLEPTIDFTKRANEQIDS